MVRAWSYLSKITTSLPIHRRHAGDQGNQGLSERKACLHGHSCWSLTVGEDGPDTGRYRGQQIDCVAWTGFEWNAKRRPAPPTGHPHARRGANTDRKEALAVHRTATHHGPRTCHQDKTHWFEFMPGAHRHTINTRGEWCHEHILTLHT